MFCRRHLISPRLVTRVNQSHETIKGRPTFISVETAERASVCLEHLLSRAGTGGKEERADRAKIWRPRNYRTAKAIFFLLPSFHLSRSLLEPTSDNSPRDRMMLPHAILNTLTRPRPRPRPGGPSLRRSLLSLSLVLEISRDTSRKKREKKRCVMHVLCGDRTTDRATDRG